MRKLIIYLFLASLAMSVEARIHYVSFDDNNQDFISKLDERDKKIVQNAKPTTIKLPNSADGNKLYTVYIISAPLLYAERDIFLKGKFCADRKRKIVYLTQEELDAIRIADSLEEKLNNEIAKQKTYKQLLNYILEWEKLYKQYTEDNRTFQEYRQAISSKEISEVNIEEVKAKIKSIDERIKQDIEALSKVDIQIHEFLSRADVKPFVTQNSELYAVFKPSTIEKNKETLKNATLRKKIIAVLQKYTS